MSQTEGKDEGGETDLRGENEQAGKETKRMSKSILGACLQVDLGVRRTLFAAACMEYARPNDGRPRTLSHS